MANIVIKKHVSFDFLGQDYKDAYINFRAIPIGEFEKIRNDMSNADKNKIAAAFLAPILPEYFIDGKFPNDNGELQAITKEDLAILDAPSVLECWKGLSGQDLVSALQRSQETGEPVEVNLDPKSPTP